MVDRFREARLIVPDIRTALGLESICDLTHESLIRQWRRLGEWIKEEAEAAAIYRRLEDIAVRHEKGGASLLRGLDLKSAEAWVKRTKPQEAWALRYGEHFQHVVQLIADSKRRRWRVW